MRGACATWWRTTARRPSNASTPPTRRCRARATSWTSWTSTARSTAWTWSSCTSGTTTSWCAAWACTARARAATACCSTIRTTARLPTRRAMAADDLRHYDGVLAFGAVLRELYLERGWAARAWTWHEAADTRVFRLIPHAGREGDVVWIGNWGDDERSAELEEFLLEPVKALGLRARVYGVRYPEEARRALDARRHRVLRLDRQLRSAAGLRALRRHRAHPAPPVRGSTAAASRPSGCSRRWPAASRWSPPPGTTARGCSSPGRDLPGGRQRQGDAAAPPRPDGGRGHGAATGAARPPDHSGAPHLRAPRRRAARHLPASWGSPPEAAIDANAHA